MEPISLPVESSPWHEGELTLQRSVGAVKRMAGPGKQQMARDWMPDQHREFYAQLPFAILGAVDPAGDVWATMKAGPPGFMQSPEPRRLALALSADSHDPADAGIADGQGIGMLGIELNTRRRNRLNGTVRQRDAAGFEIETLQAYGNCPQYIQLRHYQWVGASPGAVAERGQLSTSDRALIGRADSFYVASYIERDEARQVDVSHRGGKPGFVAIAEDGTLTVPDFSGNLFFNTLGNFLLNPRGGLLFVDFQTGDILQMAGRAEVLLDAPEIGLFVGAERLWRFRPERIVYRPAALPLRWVDDQDGMSPNAKMTGSWGDAASRMKAAELAQQWRPFLIERTVDENQAVRSFYLVPVDGAGMPHAKPGQHLPVRWGQSGSATEVHTLPLSSAPSDPFLRISVKHEDLFRGPLNAVLKPGDIVEAQAPVGEFTLDASLRRSVVLLAAGEGITPLVSMARHLIHEGNRTRYRRPAWMFHATRTHAQRAFMDELNELVGAGKDRFRYVRVLSDAGGATKIREYDVEGRISLQLLKQVLPFDDYDFYLCGPDAFMQDLYDVLRNMNVTDARIHAHSFADFTLLRRT